MAATDTVPGLRTQIGGALSPGPGVGVAFGRRLRWLVCALPRCGVWFLQVTGAVSHARQHGRRPGPVAAGRGWHGAL